MEGIKTLNSGSVPTRHAALPLGPEVLLERKERNCAHRSRTHWQSNMYSAQSTYLNKYILFQLFI